jgi:hypothetical protein
MERALVKGNLTECVKVFLLSGGQQYSGSVTVDDSILGDNVPNWVMAKRSRFD